MSKVKSQKLIVQQGFSVVEIVIASAVLALTVTAFVGALLYFNKSTSTAGARARAVFLAEEGLEATRNIRDEDFSNLTDGTYGFAVSGGQWVFSGAQDTTDIFDRQLTVSAVDANTKQINSIVSWDEGSGRSGEVSLITYLTYWQEVAAFDSCGAFCGSLDYGGGLCRANATECSASSEVHEPEGNQYCAVDPAENTCCCQPPSGGINSCGEYCASIGYSAGACRQNSNKCAQNNEIYEVGGDNYCTGGPSVDTCCCE